MHLVRSGDIDEVEYVRFLDSFAGRPGVALAYHYPFYLRFLADVAYPGSRVRFVTARGDDGRLAGVVPAVHLQAARVNAWLSLPYFGPNGGALVHAHAGADGDPLVRSLVKEARHDADALGCASLTMYAPLAARPEQYREGLDVPEFDVARVSQCFELPEGDEPTPWPRKVRYDIRRAASLGVMVRDIRDEGDLAHVWGIYRTTCEDAGIPLKPYAHVQTLFRTAGDNGVFLLAEHDGAVVAGLICLVGGGVLSYYLPCTRPESRPLQPGLLLLDAAVSRARRQGCRLLNFEGSPGVESSVYKFKARCGGQPVPYRVFVKLLRPGALDEYRRITADGIGREAPHAFVVPFGALA